MNIPLTEDQQVIATQLANEFSKLSHGKPHLTVVLALLFFLNAIAEEADNPLATQEIQAYVDSFSLTLSDLMEAQANKLANA